MKYFFLLTIPVILFSACENAEMDNERPTARIEKPTAAEVVLTADGMRLVATLKDNTGLLQYKLTIFGIDSLNDIGKDSTLERVIVEGMNEVRSLFLDEVIVLPETTFNGQYQAILTCLDIEGNESFKDTVNFEIQNSIDSDPPVFNVSGPAVNDTLTIGQGFVLSGQISDSQSLTRSNIVIERVDGSQTIYEFGFNNIIDNTIDYDQIGLWFPIDSAWTQGEYRVYYTAWDNYSGASHTIPFYIFY